MSLAVAKVESWEIAKRRWTPASPYTQFQGPGPALELVRTATRPQGPDGNEATLVIVVDDDARIRSMIVELLKSVDIDAIAFASAHDMLGADLPNRPGCFILDVRMPGLSGLDLHEHLIAHGWGQPVIFLTGHADIAVSVQAMKAGAADFLLKPVLGETLLNAVASAIECDRQRRETSRVIHQQVERVATLTRRERQVMRAVAFGRLNKQIAYDLGISEITVKVHRGNVMRKLCARSVCDLIRTWDILPASLRDLIPAPVPRLALA